MNKIVAGFTFSTVPVTTMMQIKEIITHIDLSALPAEKQPGFIDWLSQRAYIRSTLAHALQRGQLLKGYLHADPQTMSYGLRIQAQPSSGDYPNSQQKTS